MVYVLLLCFYKDTYVPEIFSRVPYYSCKNKQTHKHNDKWLAALRFRGTKGSGGGCGELPSTWPFQGKPLLDSPHPGTQAQGCRPSRRVSEARNPDFYVKSPYL